VVSLVGRFLEHSRLFSVCIHRKLIERAEKRLAAGRRSPGKKKGV